MKHYEVQSPLLHDKKRYEPGDTVEMDKDAAEPLVERGRLKGPVKAPANSEGGRDTAPASSSEAEIVDADVERLTAQVGDLNESYAAALETNEDLRKSNAELREENDQFRSLNETLRADVEQLNAKLAEVAVNDGIATGADKPAADTEPAKPKGKAPKGGKEKPGS